MKSVWGKGARMSHMKGISTDWRRVAVPLIERVWASSSYSTGVVGVVAILDGREVPLETPHAEPLYEIEIQYILKGTDDWHVRAMLTDGDKYCWKTLYGTISMAEIETLSEFSADWSAIQGYVRDAIKRYNKRIGV